MTLSGRLYFDAMTKIGENAAASPVSRELGKFLCCFVLWLSAGLNQRICRLWRFCFWEMVVYLTWVSEAFIINFIMSAV